MKNDRRAFRRGVYWTLGTLTVVALIAVLAKAAQKDSCRSNERIVDAMVTCIKAPALTCTYTPAQLIEAERERLYFVEFCRDNNG